jgi:hypothetical protein
MVLLPADRIDETARRAGAGDLGSAEHTALAALRRRADAALDLDPPTVIDKRHTPPTGDKHDYMSLSVYYWPNPDTPDGLPYVGRDGLINPEVHEYDRPALLRMADAVETLTIAWRLTGHLPYARRAAELLRAWFLDPATRMNPHMRFAQHIPGDATRTTWSRFPARWVEGAGGRGIYVSFGGVIEGATLPFVLEMAQMLRASDAWTQQDHAALRAWTRAFLDWLATSRHGRDEASCENNHGVWYRVQVAAYALFCGDTATARRVLGEEGPRLVAEHIEPDGSMPIEIGRATGLHYVTFTLAAFVDLALMAERLGLDLWNHETPDARSIRRAVEWALPYWRGEPWPFGDLPRPFDFASAIPVLRLAARRCGERAFDDAADRLPGVAPGHLYRLLY